MTATRYTRFVSLFKGFLWLLVIAMIGLVIWIASGGEGDKARVVFSNIAKSAKLQDLMLKPHYQGVDANNRPYTVIADTASQIDKDNVSMKNIHADMMMANGVWVALQSGSGVINTKTKQLALHERVDLFYDKGYEFRTDHANVDIGQGSAYGDAHIEGQGPAGTLQADSFTISERGQRIRFDGNVKMKLYR